MTAYLTRAGRRIEADEAFFAWTSADLPRMLKAQSIRTNPIDRHFLLMGIVRLTYALRSNPADRARCLEVGLRHIGEFAAIAPGLRVDMGGVLPRVPTFAQVATLLTEAGRFDEAAEVCRTAISYGLHDGTKGDFSARIARIKKAAIKAPRMTSHVDR